EKVFHASIIALKTALSQKIRADRRPRLRSAPVMTAGVAGLLAGLLHVFAGPDHLAALAPLSLKAGRRAWAVGLRWGLGHSSGVLVVAAVAFVLRQVVHLEAWSGWGERLVGVTMIGLGLWGLRSLFRERLHAHEHDHG